MEVDVMVPWKTAFLCEHGGELHFHVSDFSLGLQPYPQKVVGPPLAAIPTFPETEVGQEP